MSTMNSVNIIGRLTHDPELRYTKAGKAVSTLNMAINEKYKSGDEWKTDVCFIEVTAWEGTAEACAQYLKKGNLVGVSGKLKHDTWETDGNKRSKITVTAKNVVFLEKKDEIE
jgi:single-strand DNA-binding protein